MATDVFNGVVDEVVELEDVTVSREGIDRTSNLLECGVGLINIFALPVAWGGEIWFCFF